jgi:hypothetical protein
MDQPPALPRRVAWFAPWTWTRRWLVAALLLYVVTAAPINYGINRCGLRATPVVSAIAIVVYAPLVVFYYVFPPYQCFCDAQDDLLVRAFGMPFVAVPSALPRPPTPTPSP